MSQPKRVLIVGAKPELVDYSDPAIPPGMNADKVRLGLDIALGKLRERGFQSDMLLTSTDDAAAGEVARALAGQHYDCIVIGAGLRIVLKMTRVFEAV